jgi:deazaflavin-dependent oxidoreductase (nitroreductase family)
MTMPDDMLAHNRALIAQFRAAGRRLGDRPLLLLTTTGARTGLARTSPMMFIPDGDRLLVVASNAGARRHPNWYHNLVADPRVTVEVNGEEYAATATPLAGDEYVRQFAAIKHSHPFFAEHQAKVERAIPVVALVREG